MAGYRQDQLFHIPYSCCACKNNDAAPKNFCHQKIMKPTSTVNRKNTWSHFYIKVIAFYSHFHSCTNTFIPTELHRIYIKKQSDPDSFLAPVHKKKKKNKQHSILLALTVLSVLISWILWRGEKQTHVSEGSHLSPKRIFMYRTAPLEPLRGWAPGSEDRVWPFAVCSVPIFLLRALRYALAKWKIERKDSSPGVLKEGRKVG